MPSIPIFRQTARSTTAHPVAAPVLPRAEPAENGLAFFLFLLVNAALFVRPADVIPWLQGIEIYTYLILSCLAVAFPAVLSRFSPARLEKTPIDVCVLLLMGPIILSHLGHSRPADAFNEGFRYFKILVYYFLLVSLVTTSKRMRIFLGCLIFFTAVTTLLSILDFVQVISLPRPVLNPAEENLGRERFIDPDRLYGPGIFNDPNDICVIIGTSLVLLLGKLLDHTAGVIRWLWLPVVAVFAVGFFLTQSRGGLLALLAGLFLVFVLKWGWARAMLVGTMGVPGLIALLAGRMTDLSTKAETGQERISLWNEGFAMLKDNPIFGVGQDRFSEHASHVAHNSYVQQFADTGFFGGMLFLGAVGLAVWSLYRYARPLRQGRNTIPRIILDPGYRYLHPFLAGATMVYAMGMMTLTMNFLVTTYTMLGLVSVFLERARTWPEEVPRKVDFLLLFRLIAFSLCFLVGLFVFVRLTYHP